MKRTFTTMLVVGVATIAFGLERQVASQALNQSCRSLPEQERSERSCSGISLAAIRSWRRRLVPERRHSVHAPWR